MVAIVGAGVGPGQARQVGRGLARGSSGGMGGFAIPPETGGAAHAGAAGPTVPLSGMLALQEAPLAAMADEVRDREAKRHGKDILEELAALQRALLSGQPDEASLHRLEKLTRGVPMAADPRLVAVMRAVALRARVELARREAR